ncbi:MAG: DUF21 domain-containing protein [Planctomycetaceae bacterium]|nr:DUF21 domain-containing protein [Planctomycetaceae bacterium]
MLHEVLNSISLWLPGVSLMLALTFASGFFSGSETALFSLSRDDLHRFRNGTKIETQIVSSLSQPSRLLTAILFWNLAINLSYFAISVVIARRLMNAEFPRAAWGISFLGVTSLILFGEVIPKSMAVAFSKHVSRAVIWPLEYSVRALDRVIPLLQMTTLALQRGFWSGLKEETILDADDLEKAVDLSSQSSEMITHERNILHHILDLSEIAVEELMRPRGTYVTVCEPVAWLDLGSSMPAGDFAAIVEPGTDQISAIYWLCDTIYNEKQGLESYRQSVVFLPWCANAAVAIHQMQEQMCHVAAVVDEYGQTIGVLTQQDLLDTMFSSSPSRARRILKREAVLEIDHQVYHLDGLTTLRYLAQFLEIDFDSDEEQSITVVGLLHQHLKEFPKVGNECVWKKWKLKVIEVKGPSRIRVLMEPGHHKPRSSKEKA